MSYNEDLVVVFISSDSLYFFFFFREISALLASRLLEGDEAGGKGGRDTGLAMLHPLVGDGELS